MKITQNSAELAVAITREVSEAAEILLHAIDDEGSTYVFDEQGKFIGMDHDSRSWSGKWLTNRPSPRHSDAGTASAIRKHLETALTSYPSCIGLAEDEAPDLIDAWFFIETPEGAIAVNCESSQVLLEGE